MAVRGGGALHPAITMLVGAAVACRWLAITAAGAAAGAVYDAARLVVNSFDESGGPVPEDYLSVWAGTGSSLLKEYVTDDCMQGSGALRVNYSVAQAYEWGGFAAMNHILEGNLTYNLAGCTGFSFWYNSLQPQSLRGRALFRIVLFDSSDCSDCGADTNQMEHYYGILDLLDDSPGWNHKFMELKGDAGQAPFFLTGWTGITGDKVMDKSSIKGYSIQFSIDTDGDWGSVTNGTILLDGFECTGPRVMQAAFSPQDRWERSLDRGHWLSVNHSSPDATLQATWSLQKKHVEDEQVSALQGSFRAPPTSSDCECVCAAASRRLSADATAPPAIGGVSFQVGHFLPGLAYYNLSDAASLHLWLSTSGGVADLQLKLFSGGCAFNGTSAVSQFRWSSFPQYDFPDGSDAEVMDLGNDVDIYEIQRHVSEVGLRMFSLDQGRVRVKAPPSEISEDSLQWMGHGSSVVFYILAPALASEECVLQHDLSRHATLQQEVVDLLENGTDLADVSAVENFDKAAVKGFLVELGINTSGNTDRQLLDSITIGGLHATWLPGRERDDPLEVEVGTEFVFEDSVILNLWNEHNANTEDFVATREACGDLCLQDPSCSYFAHREPVAYKNCAWSSRVSRENVLPRDVQLIPSEQRKNSNLTHFATKYHSAWIWSRRAFACTDANNTGICDCALGSGGVDSGAAISCRNASITIMPEVSPELASSMHSLSLAGTSVTLLTSKLLGPTPALRDLDLGGAVAFLEPEVLQSNPLLQQLNFTEGPTNIVLNRSSDRFSNVCCEKGPSIRAGGSDFSPCFVQVYTSGIDCATENWLSYWDEDTLLATVVSGTTKTGWAAASPAECCELCRITPGCSHFTHDDRTGSEAKCYIKTAGLDPHFHYGEPSEKNGPGFVSGWTPKYRAQSQEISIRASARQLVLGPTDAGGQGYSFEYVLTVNGPIRRGSIWIEPTSPRNGIRVEPARLQFSGGRGNESRQARLTIHATAQSIRSGSVTNLELQHEVLACDEAWNFLSMGAHHSIGITVLPTCPEGAYWEGESSRCQICSAGTFSGAGSLECTLCGRRHRSAKQSKQCFECRFGYFASPGSQDCRLPLHYYCACIFCVIMLVPLFSVFFSIADGSVTVKDITTQDGTVRVVTNEKHMFRPKLGSPAPVLLRGAGRFYDGEYRARVVDRDELELFPRDGKPCRFTMEMSFGYLQHKFPWQLVNSTVVLGLPPWVVMFFFTFMVSLAILVPKTDLRKDMVGLEPSFLLPSLFILSFVLAAVIEARRQCRLRVRRLPPIMMRVAAYRGRLISKEWCCQPCPRGAGRALAAGKLSDLKKYFEEYIGSRTMHYICGNIVDPLTRESQLSYSELVGPSQVQWFISHFWGCPFQEFVSTVVQHAKGVSREWKNVPYWICTFANNQWKIQEELGGGDWQQSSFFMALQSPTCKGTIMVMDSKVQPLKRSWCLFELLQTFLHKTSGADFDFLLGTANGILNQSGFTDINLSIRIGQEIAQLDVRDASASDPADKQMIDRLVNSLPGGFESMNKFIRESVRDVLKEVRGHVLQGFNLLEEALASSAAARSKVPALENGAGAGREHDSDASSETSSIEDLPGDGSAAVVVQIKEEEQEEAATRAELTDVVGWQCIKVEI